MKITCLLSLCFKCLEQVYFRNNSYFTIQNLSNHLKTKNFSYAC